MIIILYSRTLNERNEIINFVFNFVTLLIFFQRNLLIIKMINMIRIMNFLRIRYNL